MITDANGKPLATEKTEEAKAEAAEKRGDRQLQIARLRTGQLMLAFMDAANKRLGALGFMRQLEHQRQEQGLVGGDPQLEQMYEEVAKLEGQVVGLVEEINIRFATMDEAMATAHGTELHTNAEFFGRPIERTPETAEA